MGKHPPIILPNKWGVGMELREKVSLDKFPWKSPPIFGWPMLNALSYFHTLSCLFLILSLLSCLSVLLTVFCFNAHSVLHFWISLVSSSFAYLSCSLMCVPCILSLLPHLCSFTLSQLFTLLLCLTTTTTDRGLLTNTGRWTSTTSVNVTCQHLFLHLFSGLIWDR